MSKFIAQAVLTASNQNELNDVRLKLIDMGYVSHYSGGVTSLAINQGMYALNALNTNNFIDCNFYANWDEDLAIALFLALAEMRKKITTKDIVRWKETVYYPLAPIPVAIKDEIEPIFSLVGVDKKYYHRLSPLEVAEAVQSGQITKEHLCK